MVKSFDIKPVEQNKINIDKSRLSIYQAYEYELGKGEANSITAKQLELVIKLFEEDIKDYLEGGPQALGEEYFNEASNLISQAFDKAIKTEYNKNRRVF